MTEAWDFDAGFAAASMMVAPLFYFYCFSIDCPALSSLSCLLVTVRAPEASPIASNLWKPHAASL